MDLFIIRHGDAAPLGEGGIQDDAERPLTEKGVAQAKLLTEGLPRHGVRLGVVLSSPLVRAWQTAENMLKDWATPAPELRECDELKPGTKRRKLARRLRDVGAEAIALVGHQPDLGEFAGWLIGSRKAQIDLAKAGVIYIRCPEDVGKGGGELVWMVTPEWLTK